MARETAQPLRRGDALREARRKAGLSKASLGRLAQVDRSHLSNMEAGRRPGSIESAHRIARALREAGLDISVEQLFDLDPTPAR